MFDLDLMEYITGRMADKGCIHADQFLNRKSRCLDCPFNICIKHMNWRTRRVLLHNGKVYATA